MDQCFEVDVTYRVTSPEDSTLSTQLVNATMVTGRGSEDERELITVYI